MTLLSTESDDVAQWEVEYEPIIEVHSMGMDGPENGLRGLQLIGTNCIHAGVVRAREEERRKRRPRRAAGRRSAAGSPTSHSIARWWCTLQGRISSG